MASSEDAETGGISLSGHAALTATEGPSQGHTNPALPPPSQLSPTSPSSHIDAQPVHEEHELDESQQLAEEPSHELPTPSVQPVAMHSSNETAVAATTPDARTVVPDASTAPNAGGTRPGSAPKEDPVQAPRSTELAPPLNEMGAPQRAADASGSSNDLVSLATATADSLVTTAVSSAVLASVGVPSDGDTADTERDAAKGVSQSEDAAAATTHASESAGSASKDEGAAGAGASTSTSGVDMLRECLHRPRYTRVEPVEGWECTFFTDVEGHWPFFCKQIENSTVLSWAADGTLVLTDHGYVVHGGDAVDKVHRSLVCDSVAFTMLFLPTLVVDVGVGMMSINIV